MFIHFRCRRCKNALSVAMRQACCPMICPLCQGEIIVPSASEIAPPVREAAVVVANVAAKNEPTFVTQPQNRFFRRALVAATVGLLVLVAAGWATNRVWSKWWQPSNQEVTSVDGTESDDADSPAIDSGDQPDLIPPKAVLASGLREEEEDMGKQEPSPAAAQPAKLPAAESEPRPASAANLVVKRRNILSEEELRRQLLWAPEVGLKPADVPRLVDAFRNKLDPERLQMALEPSHIFAQRADLKTLPFHRGLANRLDRNAAGELHWLGRELHLLLDRLAGKQGETRPSAVLLSEFMKLEVLRNQKPTWLRPDAVPTLQQILGHEDLPVRLMLVDLLTRIDGRAAGVALVQHAVFDLSSEVRDAAIKGLDVRPREEYRSAMVAALRYRWAPAADHAAEAMVALKDNAAAPQLVKLLQEPDPAVPFVKKDHAKKDRHWIQEVVRLKHMDNCVTCHPPSISGTEPAQGLVPGFAVVDKQGVVPISSLSPSAQSIVAGGGSAPGVQGRGYPYQGSSNLVSTATTALTVRGDITYLRQDFSIQQAVREPLAGPSVNLRFDYLVRLQPLTEKETHEWKTQAERPASYEQREAVLFALRELTGEDLGLPTEAWEKRYPMSEFESGTIELAKVLVDAPDLQKLSVIKQMRDRKGAAYTEALAQAIPQLAEKYQQRARAALLERMKRMSRATLHDKLASDNHEVRRAAASVVGSKEESALVPDLTALLADPDPAVAEAASESLKMLRARD